MAQVFFESPVTVPSLRHRDHLDRRESLCGAFGRLPFQRFQEGPFRRVITTTTSRGLEALGSVDGRPFSVEVGG